jgi:hypothetical protein
MSGPPQPYSPTTPPARSRPLGVAILAVLIGIYGFLVFLFGLLLAVGSAALSSIGSSSTSHFLGTSGVIAGVISAIIGLIVLGLAVGLWHLRMWALVLTLLFLVFEMVVNALNGTYISFGFIVSLLLFLYLLAVNRHFR